MGGRTLPGRRVGGGGVAETWIIMGGGSPDDLPRLGEDGMEQHDAVLFTRPEPSAARGRAALLIAVALVSRNVQRQHIWPP